MVKSDRFLLLGLVLLAIPACNGAGNRRSSPDGRSDGLPGWVVSSGNHPQYPLDRYLRGFGSADGTGSEAIAQAMQSARDEMAFEIESRIETKIESIMREIHQGSDVTLQIDLRAKSQQVTNEILQGSRRVATHEDRANDITYVLVAIDRRAFADRLLSAAEDDLARAKASLASATQSLESQQPAEALRASLQSLAGLTEIERRAARALAVLPGDAETGRRVRALSTPSLMSEATEILTRLTGKIRIESVSGDGQTGAPGTDLPSPLVLRAVWQGPSGDQPLAGFPVRAEVAAKNTATAQMTAKTTGQDGSVRVFLRAIKLTGQHANPVTVALDMTSLGGDLAASMEPTVTMTYFLPTVETTRVLVVIDETIDGAPSRPPISQGLINDKLTGLGLALAKRDASIDPTALAAMKGEDLQRRFADKADYVITGTVSATPREKQGNMVSARARASLQAVELLTGRVLALEVSDQSDAAKGFALNGKDACRKAIKNAIKESLSPKLIKAFKARLTGGEGWAE